ncbi:MAG: hypothetical protein ACYDCJ_10980 [Gammaproteobacteria bacterium]
MNTMKHINKRVLLFLATILGLVCMATATYGSAQEHARNQVARNNHAVMYLGNVEVQGQANIIKILQAIKVGLQQPYSTDPKLANVLVCRLQDAAGSHLKQWLTCGTNRNLAANRDYLQTAMLVTAQDTDAGQDGGGPGSITCATSGCYLEEFSAFNKTPDSLPVQYLHTLVNGAGLRSLLHKIPNPPAQQTPGSAPIPTIRHP